MLVQIVTIEVRPGTRAVLLEAFRINCVGSRKEPGNVRFDLLGDPDNPNRFTVYEVFASAEALAAHRATAHYRECREMIDPITVTGSKRILDAVLVEGR
jgi:(4S)-4-hydroxy-5-phosphonooxypentane-2,3-dione isomerase